MDITVQLVDKAFFFAEGLNLTKAEGKKTIFVTEMSDPVIRTIASSVACGILISDTSHEDIVEQIQDEELKADTKRNLGIGAEPVAGLQDTVQAEVIEAEVTVEEEVEEVAEDLVEDEIKIEEESPLEMDDSLLEELLKGTNKAVTKKIREASITDSEKARLLGLEEGGKNRATIKSLIESI